MGGTRQKGVPYGYPSTPSGSPRQSRTGLYVIAAVVLLVVVAGVAALVMTSEGGPDAEPATQEQAAVEVSGEPLPDYPRDGRLSLDPADDPAVGMTAPTLDGENFQGEPVAIEPGGGTPVIVIFAVHWCPHCQDEIPIISEWIEQGRLPKGVDVALVSTGVDASRNNYPPSDWLASVGWSRPILLDDPDQTAGRAYGMTSFPYMVFIDGDGTVVHRASGELPIEQFGEFADRLAS